MKIEFKTIWLSSFDFSQAVIAFQKFNLMVKDTMFCPFVELLGFIHNKHTNFNNIFATDALRLDNKLIFFLIISLIFLNDLK